MGWVPPSPQNQSPPYSPLISRFPQLLCPALDTRVIMFADFSALRGIETK